MAPSIGCRACCRRQQRRLLAETMLTDMLDAVAGSRLLAGVMIVTLDPHATALGKKIGARIVTEGARDGHTGSVNAGRRLLAGEGRGGMITMPGDIPATRAGEIDAVLSAHLAAPSFTISPAHDDLGSNAVVCSPPESVPLRFGDNSYFPHLDAARLSGHRADGDPSARNRDGYRPSGRSGAFPAPAAISRHAHPHAARRTWRARAAGRAGHRLTDRRLLARRRLHDRRQVGRDHGCRSTLFRHRPIERVALHRFAADRADQRFHRRAAETPGRAGCRRRARCSRSSACRRDRWRRTSGRSRRPPAPSSPRTSGCLVISGCRASRATECMSTASRNVGPERAMPRRYIGASMWTKGSGTNSVKPPVSACRSRSASRCFAHELEVSTCPYMMVEVVRNPAWWAARCTSSHCAGVDLVGADDGAYLIVEDFRRRAGQGAETGRLQLGEEFADRQSERRRTLRHLQSARRRGCASRGRPP